LFAVVWGCAGAHRAAPSTPATEAAPAEPGEPGRSPAAEPSEPDEVSHRVEPGQTLWRIARAYDVSLEELVKVNGIDDATEIEIGQMLLVPGASEKLDIAPYPAPLPGQSGAGASGHPTVTLNVTFVWPVAGEVLSYYGEQRRTHRHKGLDIRGRDGQRVVAAETGRVVYSGNTMRGYGKTVILDHGDGVQSLYAHNSRLLVNVGDEVRRGETIAKVGRTGNATTEHCHFEIRKDRVPINPLPHLGGPEEGS
jgi:murein DD-endopeptidase MepM/ murein hydrolase activator NlpD